MIHRLTFLELSAFALLLVILAAAAAAGAWLIAGLALAFAATAIFAVYAHSAVLRYENECRAAIALLGENLAAIWVTLKDNPRLFGLIGVATILLLFATWWLGVKS